MKSSREFALTWNQSSRKLNSSFILNLFPRARCLNVDCYALHPGYKCTLFREWLLVGNGEVNLNFMAFLALKSSKSEEGARERRREGWNLVERRVRMEESIRTAAFFLLWKSPILSVDIKKERFLKLVIFFCSYKTAAVMVHYLPMILSCILINLVLLWN